MLYSLEYSTVQYQGKLVKSNYNYYYYSLFNATVMRDKFSLRGLCDLMDRANIPKVG